MDAWMIVREPERAEGLLDENGFGYDWDGGDCLMIDGKDVMAVIKLFNEHGLVYDLL